MLALSFNFPGRRYHATPWGRHVNEADVAWPPEPWRILRALIATYWRKGSQAHWSNEEAADLIDALATAPPIYRLPEGAVHAHTRHYMPAPTKKTLVFDAFAHLPDGEAIVAAWPDLELEPRLFELVQDLADGIGYLGRAESWVHCTALAKWDPQAANCRTGAATANGFGDVVSVLGPLTASGYAERRAGLLADAEAEERTKAQAAGKGPPTARTLDRKLEGRFGVTLPDRLIDAVAVDTADFQKHGWNRPPAAQEIRYQCQPLSPHPRRVATVRARTPERSRYTVARYLLAGRPQPRIEDAVRIGELMRRAALAQFGWEADPSTGRNRPLAPREISGRGSGNSPLRDAHHSHAFWLPEDADGDGLIDHVCVYAADGFDTRVRANLDRLTRLWLPARGATDGSDGESGERGRGEWRLALEGFGTCDEFADASGLLRHALAWESVTPFLATAHLKPTREARNARRMLEAGRTVEGLLAEATGYPREVRRLLQRRNIIDPAQSSRLQVDLLPHVEIHGSRRRPLQFHRFRSRGRERTSDPHGALLRVRFPEPLAGPLALGYGCHFGLGLFAATDSPDRRPDSR
ncbi:MAG: type I-U CRISPR-associated protein Csb2 [Spirochaetaceae bacterium]|nr:type I-U CRISPR-associated protein Csb2 [Spirochaetaceae bacterium]